MNTQISWTRPHLTFTAAGRRHLLPQIFRSRGNAKNEATKPFKQSYGWAWQCYSKLNFNETRKMLNLWKVYQMKGHLKDTNAPGPRHRHRGITTSQRHSRSRICKLHRHPEGGRPALCKYAGFYSEGKAS